MSKKIKLKSEKNTAEGFSFNFQVILRLVFFIIIIIVLVNYFAANIPPSSSVNDPTVLGVDTTSKTAIDLKQVSESLYQQLPAKSRDNLNNIGKNPAIIYIQDKISYLQSQSQGFPQKQLNEIKKGIITSIYQDLIRNIDLKK